MNFDIERSARTLLDVLAKFFHIRFALIAFSTSFAQNCHWQTLQFLQQTSLPLFKYARSVSTASNLRRRVSRCKSEMIKVHKNAPPNREAGRPELKIMR